MRAAHARQGPAIFRPERPTFTGQRADRPSLDVAWRSEDDRYAYLTLRDRLRHCDHGCERAIPNQATLHAHRERFARRRQGSERTRGVILAHHASPGTVGVHPGEPLRLGQACGGNPASRDGVSRRSLPSTAPYRWNATWPLRALAHAAPNDRAQVACTLPEEAFGQGNREEAADRDVGLDVPRAFTREAFDTSEQALGLMTLLE